jgi:DNA-binding NarL/FixJ family response regulator
MQRIRVLLVDDNLEFLDIAGSLLEGHDYEIVGKAENGEDGLKAAIRLQPDVVVLDVSMPGLNGFEVARRLRQQHKSGAGIVLLTFHEDVDYLRAARALGVQGYVIKRRMATDLPIAVRDAVVGRPFASPPLGSDLDPQEP